MQFFHPLGGEFFTINIVILTTPAKFQVDWIRGSELKLGYKISTNQTDKQANIQKSEVK